jgi:hypothetical protein
MRLKQRVASVDHAGAVELRRRVGQLILMIQDKSLIVGLLRLRIHLMSSVGRKRREGKRDEQKRAGRANVKCHGKVSGTVPASGSERRERRSQVVIVRS